LDNFTSAPFAPTEVTEHRRRQIAANYRIFEHLVQKSQRYLTHSRYDAAATFAEVAAHFATWNHTGLFASSALERLLATIASRAIPHTDSVVQASVTGRTRVVHVASMVAGLAGLQHLLRRWIQHDNNSSHTVIVSQPSRGSCPPSLAEEVAASGGEIHEVGNESTSLVGRARRIRELAQAGDIAVLHLQTEDVAPILAFAGWHERPPVMLVNHADHAFWLGASVVDLVVNLRESGLTLCRTRRGIDRERLGLLPTLLDPPARHISKREARRVLGIPETATVLLSVARSVKYTPRSEDSFAAAIVPVLQQHPDSHLCVVGPSHEGEWHRCSQQTGGRIKAFGRRSDTSTFFQSADIYVDSFPLPSVTSLLEAATYGLPVLTRCLSTDPDCTVWCTDAPGLDHCLIRCPDLPHFHETLSGLIVSREQRERLGVRTKDDVSKRHIGTAWTNVLQDIYQRVRTVKGRRPSRTSDDVSDVTELDLLTLELLVADRTLDEVLDEYRAHLPWDATRIKLALRQVVCRPKVPNWLRTSLDQSGLRRPARFAARAIRRLVGHS
jgi:hypothetical protein